MSDDEFRVEIKKVTAALQFISTLWKIVAGVMFAVLGGAAWVWNTNTKLAAQEVELLNTNARFAVFMKESTDAHRKYEELLARMTTIVEMQQKQLDRLETKK